jgi:photosystem II stability/assembly factor-like uncharacterized protein
MVMVLGVLLFLLSACAADGGILGSGTWQASGLQGQTIRTLTVDPNNENTIYAGSSTGSVFVSTDAAAHWSTRNTGLPAQNSISALSFDVSGKILYAATAKGLFHSTDGGEQWNSVSASLPADAYTALAFGDAHAPLIFVATAHHGVYSSSNNGASWQPTSKKAWPQNIAVNGLSYDPTHQQLWAATSAGVYRSNDEGRSWSAYNTGLPADDNVHVVAPAYVSGGDPDLVYVATQKGFFISKDNGAHWSVGQDSIKNIDVYTLLVDFRSPDAATVYIGTKFGALRSDDKGQTWQEVGTGMPKNATVTALTIGANQNTRLFGAADQIYFYPGTTGSSGSNAHIFTIVGVVIFFLVLYYVATSGRRRSIKALRAQQRPANSERQIPPDK